MSGNITKHKIQNCTLYYKTAEGRCLCERCPYKRPYRDYCVKFNMKLNRINQRNGGFHHEPCAACYYYTIQQQDIRLLTSLDLKRRH